MSSNNPAHNKDMPIYRKVWSVRTLFLLLITGVGLFLALFLLWAGAGIMNSTISQYGTELMREKLHSLILPVDLRYASLKRIGLEDSQEHRDEIRNTALQEFAAFRYKETGALFVIAGNGTIILSPDFRTEQDRGFNAFFTAFKDKSGTMEYRAAGKERFAVYRLYPPWNSYIGLSVDNNELYAPKRQFIRISLMLVAGLLLATILFSGFIQRLIILPLIRLTHYVNQISKGHYEAELPGKFRLELGALKIDIQQMVTTLRQKMQQTTAQLQMIKDREIWLDQAMAALQESEKKYRTIYNAPTEAILIYDPREEKIIDANRAMLGMFGLHHDDLPTLGFEDLCANEEPFSQQEIEHKIISVQQEGPQLFEWMMRKHDGEMFWSEISLQASFIAEKENIIAVIRNIHPRKMAEEELTSEKERLAVTLRSIGDGVITTDELGRIVLMNRIGEELSGWKQAEAAGRKFREVFHIVQHENGEACENPVDRILQTGQKIDLAEDTVLIAKNGIKRHIAHSGAPIFDPESRIIGAVIVFRDVTEEKRMEEELFKIKKLESVGVLAGGIAHDFNNILVAILGNLSLARQHIDNPEETKVLLSNMEKAALRAKDLTSQLLTFSRGGEPVLKTASIKSLITESAVFVLRGSNIRVSFDIPDDLWLVNIDTGQISQVIHNIVLNARQAMPEEGEVNISCSNCRDCLHGPEALREQCVRVIIRDNGPGIAPDILPKIFDPYFSTKEDGSGLGLAICHSIIKKHHGFLSVDSAPGEGTTFTIQLPVGLQLKNDKDPVIPMHFASEKSARILLMDDDEMILQLAGQMLRFMGHEVTPCRDGRECLDLYEKAMIDKTPYDLVIMDLTIPGGMGGGKTIKELLKLDPQVRAIVSSGYSNDPVMAEYAEHGFKAVVVKPYQLEDLNRAVQITMQS